MGSLKFGNLRWEVRKSEGLSGPGPNIFDPRNVRLLSNGDLRLEVTRRDGAWTSAELQTTGAQTPIGYLKPPSNPMESAPPIERST